MAAPSAQIGALSGVTHSMTRFDRPGTGGRIGLRCEMMEIT
jgi:hypothetical protein